MRALVIALAFLFVTPAHALTPYLLEKPSSSITQPQQQFKHKHSRKSKGGASASIACLQPSTKALWAKVTAYWGPMRVVSTCRLGARVRGTGRVSRHAHGHAIDFYAPKGKKQAVVRWLIANHTSGGVMTYRNMGHIHIDIGPRFVRLGARG